LRKKIMSKTPTAAGRGDLSQRWNRDEDLRPDREGHPPRPATEPKGSKLRSGKAKTATDPATGEPQR
jgi:hypothetical protein